MGKQISIEDAIPGKVVETTEQKLDNEKQKEAALREAVRIALDVDRAFKLFSFRLISPEQYVSEVKLIMNQKWAP